MAATYTGYAICPRCGRKVATLIPKGGDGSASVFHRHVPKTGLTVSCDGSRAIVPSYAYVDD